MIDWTEDIKEQIVDGILDCKPIVDVLAELGIAKKSFYRMRLRDKEYDTTIAHAQEMAQEAEVDRLLTLADSATGENANAVKLQIWARMWIAGKRKPKKYGDKITQEHTGEAGGPIQIISTIPRPGDK